jgi:hypothetical protein
VGPFGGRPKTFDLGAGGPFKPSFGLSGAVSLLLE